MERLIERVREAVRLALIVGTAAVNLGLAACSSDARAPVDGGSRDAKARDAARPERDAGARDATGRDAAARDAAAADSARDAQRPDGAAADAPTPADSKLWDVLCE